MTGYSAYQSARAGGIPQGQSIGAGVMGGIGAMSGMVAAGVSAGGFLGGATAATTGTLLGMGPVGWVILGIAATVGAILMSTMGSKKATQTSIDTRTTENKLSSKIDITNKQLEYVNRNLIAMRSDIRTYILPQSAYWSEKNSLEAEFSLASRRGNF